MEGRFKTQKSNVRFQKRMFQVKDEVDDERQGEIENRGKGEELEPKYKLKDQYLSHHGSIVLTVILQHW